MAFIENIHGILAAVVLVLVDLAAIYKAVKVIVSRAQAVKDSTAEEREEAKKNIIETLRPIIFGWVADAERDMGGGTGKLKSAKVAGWIYEKIPDEIKPLVTAKEIQDLIDDVLKEAQLYWEKNKKARDYINSGAVTTLTAELQTVEFSPDAKVEEIAKAVGDKIAEALTGAAAPELAEDAATDRQHDDGPTETTD